MHAVNADESHQHEPQVSHQEAAVLDGVRHGEDAGAEVPLEQVDDGVRVGDLVVGVRLALVILVPVTEVAAEITVRVTRDGEGGDDDLLLGRRGHIVVPLLGLLDDTSKTQHVRAFCLGIITLPCVTSE